MSRLVSFRLLRFQKFVTFGATCPRALGKGANPPSLHACMLSHSIGSESLQPCGLYPRQAPLSTGFSRQEYWSGLPFPSFGKL